MLNSGHRVGVAIALFVVAAVVYNLSRVTNGYDSLWSIPTAVSIVREHNIDLIEYRPLIHARDRYGIRKKFGQPFNYFPLGASLLAVPLIAVGDLFPNASAAILRTQLKDGLPDYVAVAPRIEKVVASIVVGLAASLIFLTAFLVSESLTAALVTWAAFAFGTAAWSIGSRALWQHGPSMLMLSAAILILVKSQNRPGLLRFAGLPLGFAYLIRPTNILLLVLIGLWVCFRERRECLGYFLYAGLSIVPFFAFNHFYLHSWLPEYYRGGRINLLNFGWIQPALANLISPSRGLLIFSPVLLFGICASIWRLCQRRATSLELLLWVITVAHLIVVSAFPRWWAGHTYGPRFMSDILPIFALLTVEWWRERPRIAWQVLFWITLTISIFIQAKGANSLSVYAWNSYPKNVDDRPNRVWNWKDPQFLR